MEIACNGVFCWWIQSVLEVRQCGAEVLRLKMTIVCVCVCVCVEGMGGWVGVWESELEKGKRSEDCCYVVQGACVHKLYCCEAKYQ